MTAPDQSTLYPYTMTLPSYTPGPGQTYIAYTFNSPEQSTCVDPARPDVSYRVTSSVTIDGTPTTTDSGYRTFPNAAAGVVVSPLGAAKPASVAKPTAGAGAGATPAASASPSKSGTAGTAAGARPTSGSKTTRGHGQSITQIKP